MLVQKRVVFYFKLLLQKMKIQICLQKQPNHSSYDILWPCPVGLKRLQISSF